LLGVLGRLKGIHSGQGKEVHHRDTEREEVGGEKRKEFTAEARRSRRSEGERK